MTKTLTTTAKTEGAEDIADWFMERLGGTFLILKEEGGDADRVRMKVRKVLYWPGSRAADDYVEEDRVILVGEGRIDGDGDRNTAAAKLPRDSYEIPLGGAVRRETQDGSLRIVTARAAYTVSPLTEE